jgi:hypothetical protein
MISEEFLHLLQYGSLELNRAASRLARVRPSRCSEGRASRYRAKRTNNVALENPR